MMKKVTISLCILSLLGLTAMAQQNVTISPGDDVVDIIGTVVDFDSTITFEAGYYKAAPKEDGTGRPDLMRLPPGTTVSGAGSGMDPSTATIIDCGFAFDSAIKVDNDIDGLTFENLTVINTVDAAIEFDAGSFGNTFNNVWALKAMANCVDMNDGAEATFDFCVFGWSSGDAVNVADTSIGVFTNCDIFLGSSDVVQSEDSSDAVYRNCIFYAGPGANDLESAGFITVTTSVGWDPLDSDEPGNLPTALGRLDLNGGAVFVDEASIGEDPLYVAPPGLGNKAEEMDLHLQEGSPALTVGNTSFDDNGDPNGDSTFAGSQGPAGVNVNNWSIY